MRVRSKKGVFTAAHTYAEHICECPPPPPGPVIGFLWGHRMLGDDIFQQVETLPPMRVETYITPEWG